MRIDIRRVVRPDGVNAHPAQHFIDKAVASLTEIMLHVGVSVFSAAEDDLPFVSVSQDRIDVVVF